MEQLRRRKECEKKQCIKINFSENTATAEEFESYREKDEKEFFKEILNRRELCEEDDTSSAVFGNLANYGIFTALLLAYYGFMAYGYGVPNREILNLSLKRLLAINTFGLRTELEL